MSDRARACPGCGGSDLYVTTTDASGSLGPDLLPGIGSVLTGAKLDVVVCKECGHLGLFVPTRYLEKLSDARKWRKVE